MSTTNAKHYTSFFKSETYNTTIVKIVVFYFLQTEIAVTRAIWKPPGKGNGQKEHSIRGREFTWQFR